MGSHVTYNALAEHFVAGVGGQGMNDTVIGCSILGGHGGAVQLAVLMGAGRPQPRVGQCILGSWHLGGVTAVQCDRQSCWGVGSCAIDNALASRGVFGGHVVVHGAVLLRDGRPCNG